MEKIKNRIFPLRIGFKITFAYFIIILLTVVCSSVVFRQLSIRSARDKISEAAIQTLFLVESSINLLFEDVNNYSKIILSEDNLQNLLQSGNVYASEHMQTQVNRYLLGLLQTTPLIDSVSVFDNDGHEYSAGKSSLPIVMVEKIQAASWYEDVVASRGAYLLSFNAGGVFRLHEQGNFISLIRQIEDIDTGAPLGILSINIAEASIRQSYENIVRNTKYRIVVLDKDGSTVMQSDDDAVVLEIKTATAAHMIEAQSGYFTHKSGGEQYLVSYISQQKNSWNLISIIPYDNVDDENTWLVLTALIISVINAVIMLVSTVAISKKITTPINKLLSSMREVETGTFRTIPEDTSGYEFNKLFAGYNLMIEEMKRLIARVIEEQDTIRKAELNALQSQIKPHFLYNTLDSALSLLYSGENERACALIEALEGCYRLGLSKGSEVVTIGTEVEFVKKYLFIQKVRFPEMFDVVYEIEEGCLDVPILRLILQPLVENALYHGIRNMGKKGNIAVNVQKNDGGVEISVSDDGVGMDSDTIKRLLNRETNATMKFGLWGTLERVRIFCNNSDCVRVESRPGHGTKITIVLG